MPWNEIGQWIGLVLTFAGLSWAAGRKTKQVDQNTEDIAELRENAGAAARQSAENAERLARLDERTTLILSMLDDIKASLNRLE